LLKNLLVQIPNVIAKLDPCTNLSDLVMVQNKTKQHVVH